MLTSAVILILVINALSFENMGCTPGLIAAGVCGSAITDGSSVEVGASATRPGTPGHSGGGRERNPGGPGSGGQAPAAPPCASALCRPGYGVIGLPDVTAADLASFVPAAPALTGEPLGLGVAGMPTNLVAAASTQLQSGPLLGYDVTVRFRPVAYRFDHGDGSGASHRVGGTTWASLGLPDYTATATSHTYAAPGIYRVTAAVVYEAHVDFGSGAWRPVQGSVTSSATAYDVRVVEIRSALVARTCLEDPAGPAC